MADQPIQPNEGVNGEIISSNSSQIDFSTLLPQIIEKFIAVLEAVVIIAVGIFIIRYLRMRLKKMELTHEQQRNAINLLEKIISGFIIVVSITIALKVVGIDMTLLVSVAILGLSYGLQDIIKNYVAGILILFKAPFKIGDIVKIRDFTGRVTKIDFQSTTLETFDKRHITIYNSDVMTQSIVNFSNNTVRRLDFDIMLGYGTDTTKAITVFETILNANPQVLKSPKFSIVFKKFTDTGSTFTLKFWIQRPSNLLKVRTEIATAIQEAFDDNNIIMPYTKGIEVENENQFSLFSEQRRQRLQTFYQLPLFAQAPLLQNENPLQISPDTETGDFGFEEPE